MLYLLSAVLAASVVVVAAFCRRHGRALPGPEVAIRLKEPVITLWMGGFLWLETAVLIGIGFAFPLMFGGRSDAELNVALFLLLSIVLGAYLMLYGSVKRLDLSETGLLYVDPIGRRRSLRWDDVDGVEAVAGKRFFLLSRHGRIPVGGNRKDMRDCLLFADRHLDPALTGGVFPSLKQSLSLP
ncbi:PH domain-containing protein [Telmatospirillum siberiense]|uniref:PH domain-containing protein n=1 Tax=Telmatospirillum siberiense TaxID=382514 RepID=A0A2N3PWB2_9PROT|nr:PH domain-containing protein [Telmatospirillum siberiense]PKU24668.1 hypothetical protein CWS72_10005 [Telmatospirillum siberiense]